jgi:hypothetical protein
LSLRGQFDERTLSALRDSCSGLLKLLPSAISRLAKGQVPLDRRLEAFATAYNITRFCALLDPDGATDALSGLGNPGQNPSVQDPNLYMANRIVARGRHLVSEPTWLKEWVQFLQSCFDDPQGVRCRRFAAYQATYFADGLDDWTWPRICTPDDFNDEWWLHRASAVITETAENLNESW